MLRELLREQHGLLLRNKLAARRLALVLELLRLRAH